MKTILEAGPLAVMLLVVLAVIALASYSITHDPHGDLAKGFAGALTLAFGAIVTHLFSKNSG